VRQPKRINPGTENENKAQEEGEDVVMSENSQRPQRTAMPSRRALEAISANTLLRPQLPEVEE
jgi:hypothetical protein